MERLDIYRKYTQELLDRGLAYKCFCTPEELEAEHDRQVNAGIAPMYNRKCRDLSPEEVAKKKLLVFHILLELKFLLERLMNSMI